MWATLKNHERFVRSALSASTLPMTLERLRDLHNRQLGYMQHERLIHLLVTLFVCLFLLLSIGYTLLFPALGPALLSGLFLILTCAYLLHYFRLENGVQRWYGLANQIEDRLAKAG